MADKYCCPDCKKPLPEAFIREVEKHKKTKCPFCSNFFLMDENNELIRLGSFSDFVLIDEPSYKGVH